MLLRRDGHEVTVLERDPAAVPESGEDAWEGWSREGVTQFRLPHLMLARRPVGARARASRCLRGTRGGRRPAVQPVRPASDDHRAYAEGGRRADVDAHRAPAGARAGPRAAAEAEPGLEVRRGVAVQELLMGAYDGTPHVSGIRTSSREELRADLVVDAMGRRSQLPGWLEAAGTGPVYQEAEDSGFIYYARHFRARNGASAALPALRAPAVTVSAASRCSRSRPTTARGR